MSNEILFTERWQCTVCGLSCTVSIATADSKLPTHLKNESRFRVRTCICREQAPQWKRLKNLSEAIGDTEPEVFEGEIYRLIADELIAARREHAPMHSPHEGIAVIREEYRELEDEVFLKKQSKEDMKKEAIQLSAMCVRLIADCRL